MAIPPCGSKLILLFTWRNVFINTNLPVSQVAVTFAVGSEVGLQSSSDFGQMGKPFLMGTVALGENMGSTPFFVSFHFCGLFIFTVHAPSFASFSFPGREWWSTITVDISHYARKQLKALLLQNYKGRAVLCDESIDEGVYGHFGICGCASLTFGSGQLILDSGSCRRQFWGRPAVQMSDSLQRGVLSPVSLVANITSRDATRQSRFGLWSESVGRHSQIGSRDFNQLLSWEWWTHHVTDLIMAHCFVWTESLDDPVYTSYNVLSACNNKKHYSLWNRPAVLSLCLQEGL